MASRKIIGMPLRVMPQEPFEFVVLVVNTEIDSYAYDPYSPKPDAIDYYIYDRDGNLISSGNFFKEVASGLFITKDTIRINDIGTYAVRFFCDAIKATGFTHVHVSAADNYIYQKLDAKVSTRASQTSVDAVKAQTDKMQFDANNYIKANVQDKGVLNDPSASDIDAQLSSSHGSGSWETADVSNLALESTAQSIKSQTDKLQFDANNYVKANVQDKGILNDPSVTDIDNQLSSTHGSGSWEGGSGGSCDPEDIWTYSPRSLTEPVDITSSSQNSIVDKMWDEPVSEHISSGTFGLYISQIYAKVTTILQKLKNLW